MILSTYFLLGGCDPKQNNHMGSEVDAGGYSLYEQDLPNLDQFNDQDTEQEDTLDLGEIEPG